MHDIDAIFARLSTSPFRSRFRLGPRERDYLAKKGLPVVLAHARDFIATRLAPAEPPNDGKQTPFRGHPVFVAQHATATCCRGCLAKWHGIARGRPLDEGEVAHIAAVLERWLRRQMAPAAGAAQTLDVLIATCRVRQQTADKEITMYIAMNRFKVKKGCEHDFEQVWANRQGHLSEMPGFIVFHLLKGPEREDHTLYSSHAMWRSHADFEAWTKSEQFRKAHANAGSNKPLYLGHPEFEGFTVVQEEKADGTRVIAAE